MPELPEIETIKLQLQQHLMGQTIEKLEQLHQKSVQGNKDLVKGRTIKGIERFGKMLVLDLNKDVCIAIHFKMTGQLILVRSSQFAVHSGRNKTNRIVGGPARNASTRLPMAGTVGQVRVAGGHPTADWVKDLPSKHTRAIFHLKGGDKLYFNDQRLFGWIKILSKKDLSDLSYLKGLGPEVWDLTDEGFQHRLVKSKRAIKLALMDQAVISGVGNIYANDALWEAKIHPLTAANQLSLTQAQLLRQALVKVLQEGIKYGGATAPDDSYINLYGLGGSYQNHFRVYAREGEKCQKCGGVIKRIELGGRGTFYCSKCQK